MPSSDAASIFSSDFSTNLSNQNDDNDDESWMFPLLLSFLAGASTCVGAAIVFCFDAKQIEKSMTFSLSLAASVMITVSVISIGPECLEDVVTFPEDDTTNNGRKLVTIDMWLMVERLLSCGAGCFGYWLLSKALAAFPEPESFFVKKSTNQPSSPRSSGSSSNNNNNNKYAKNTKNSDIMMDEEVSSTEMAALIRRSTSGESTASNKDQPPSSSSSNPRSSPTNSSNTLSLRRTPSKMQNFDFEEGGGGNNNDNYYESKKNKEDASSRKRSWRVAMLLFFSLLFHNFPEGLAVAASTVESRQLGVTVAIGILIHNIPEGIAIAVPCIAARPDMPWLAFWLASGSGLAEPLGAVFALFYLRQSKIPMENVLACVAGIMCTVAGVELYPEALRHLPTINNNNSNNNESSSSARKDYSQLIYGTVVGMAIMIATEWYLP